MRRQERDLGELRPGEKFTFGWAVWMVAVLGG